jgi:hypothetical protein
MATFKILPVDNTPARRVTTSFAGKIITLRTYYNQTDNGWFCDFYDVDNNPLVIGRALNPGIDIFRQFVELELGNLAYIVTDNSEGQSFEDLGLNAKLVSRVE